jgi:hypothetical protein
MQTKKQRRSVRQACSVGGCTGAARGAHGMCGKHSMRYRRTGTTADKCCVVCGGLFVPNGSQVTCGTDRCRLQNRRSHQSRFRLKHKDAIAARRRASNSRLAGQLRSYGRVWAERRRRKLGVPKANDVVDVRQCVVCGDHFNVIAKHRNKLYCSRVCKSKRSYRLAIERGEREQLRQALVNFHHKRALEVLRMMLLLDLSEVTLSLNRLEKTHERRTATR